MLYFLNGVRAEEFANLDRLVQRVSSTTFGIESLQRGIRVYLAGRYEMTGNACCGFASATIE